MGKCVTCGSETKGRIKKCDSCKRILSAPDKQYITPEVELTKEEKEQLEEIRRVYDPGFYFEEYFRKAEHSII